jgi:hypothetical protein
MTEESIIRETVEDMLRQLKARFDVEMKRIELRTNTVLDLCNAMNAAAHMLIFKYKE